MDVWRTESTVGNFKEFDRQYHTTKPEEYINTSPCSTSSLPAFSFGGSEISQKSELVPFKATGAPSQCSICAEPASCWMNPRAMHFSSSSDVQKYSQEILARKQYLMGKLVENYPAFVGKIAFQETVEEKIIKSLIYVEHKLRQSREATHRQDYSFLDRDIQELIICNQNELTKSEKYTKESNWSLSSNANVNAQIQKEMLERRPPFLTLDLFLSVEVAKTFPVFHMLDYYDQTILLKHIAIANTVLVQAFYSCQLHADTLTMPNGFSPIKSTFWKTQVLDDSNRQRFSTLKDAIYCRIMEPFLRVGLTMEEFVLLKAIIYSHSAISELSHRGRTLLEKECERYSKVLMRHLQCHMGSIAGARKYAEIISLVDCIFRSAQHQREFHVYLQTVFRFRRQCPKFMDFLMYG
ncbi:ligand-binding domain of nuclear hormone receptor domain-containing protein [Ditylenchus destructor]|uniref:Ligand-binding domain of nuclear hormone receptor domain-containing protein n=1 Tax=Ditylenchus destructor TaxID=166010 RepID=A0AAD4R932_9BILA|nr:ligand-binding domain of nuclear hormone receptor domain-containing protein [Ditylenchus destructor]